MAIILYCSLYIIQNFSDDPKNLVAQRAELEMSRTKHASVSVLLDTYMIMMINVSDDIVFEFTSNDSMFIFGSWFHFQHRFITVFPFLY